MEEELNEHELEERLYAMLHHVDETQINVTEATQKQNDANNLVDNTTRSTMRRYWRTGAECNPYQKVNNNKEPTPVVNKAPQPSNPVSNVPKEERTSSPPVSSSVDLSIFQSPIPANLKSTIEIIEHENDNAVLLESSDEDEVVEVELPPKPTITIEDSDEDELQIVKPDSPAKTPTKPDNKSGERGISASPVPSVVSSVSDDFIRGDCIALNISSRQPNNPSFDFSLHGPDLIQDTPSKKKKKKKSKEVQTSTPIVSTTVDNSDSCFATPKSKAKNKKQANTHTLTAKNIQNIDIYDSDSNQSMDISKTNQYTVTDKSLPSVDVYESDSSQSEVTKDNTKTNDADSSDSSSYTQTINTQTESTIDLTGNDTYNTISENIVMGNVTGFDTDDFDQVPTYNNDSNNDISKYVSSKVPSILYEDLDFDNLKGKNTVCKNRKYSLTSLRAEMEKFYNESWGGEEFNHREIQKYMSRDKSLWAIDPKDKMPSLAQRKIRCNYCNRVGHRDDTCRMKPLVCYMCGTMGHIETRCPAKICVNCGSPNHMYTNVCRNCSSWGNVQCAECGQMGHPASHCPDIWRRYHNTIEINKPLEKCFQSKKCNQLYCSGCARRGHLIHTCRTTIPFSGLPINSPFIFSYRAIFTQPKPKHRHFEDTPLQTKKRQSKSPIHETHVNKKRNMSITEDDKAIDKNKTKNANADSNEKALDFIPISSSNHDNKGQIIQDNQVSDTSDVITSARIYVTNDVIEKLKSKEGQDWLDATCKKLNVTVENSEIASFLNIKGKLADQETFQLELREWNQSATNNDKIDAPKTNEEDLKLIQNLPKNKKNLIRKLDQALDSLSHDIGDPKLFFNELTYSQNRHEQLLKKKTIPQKTLQNSRTHINDVVTKLNTVLLGQAGLADGANHVNQLYALKEKLYNCKNKNVALYVRKEIGEHYQNIFGPIVRNDYSELVRKYYLGKSVSPLKKNKNVLKPLPKMTKNIMSIPPQHNDTNDFKEVNNQNHNGSGTIWMRKLVFFHKRLQRLQVKGKVLKKEKIVLIRRLHTLIGSFFKKETLNSKLLKKAKKAHAEAQKFLNQTMQPSTDVQSN